MGPIGVQEMIAIFVIALVLFGPKKLPELGRTIGKALSEFRRAKNELKSTFETHMRELERETKALDPSASPTYDYSPAHYSYPYEDYNHHDPAQIASSTSAQEVNGTGSAERPAVAPATDSAEDSTVQPFLEITPVADTVPRGNGARPVESVPAADHREHPV